MVRSFFVLGTVLAAGLAASLQAQGSGRSNNPAMATAPGAAKPGPPAPGTAVAPPASVKPVAVVPKDENSDKEKLFLLVKTVAELKQQLADLKAETTFLANQNKALEAKLKSTNQELSELNGYYSKHTHAFANGTYVGGWAGLPLFTQVIATPKDTPLKIGPPVHP